MNLSSAWMLCSKLGWNRSSGSGEEDLKFRHCIFAISKISSLWKNTWPIILTKLNPLYPRMHCAKHGWNWPSGSWEEDGKVKSLQTDGRTDGRKDRQTDNRWSGKLTWAFSSGEIIKNMFKIQTLTNEFHYVYIHTPVSMWPCFNVNTWKIECARHIVQLLGKNITNVNIVG